VARSYGLPGLATVLGVIPGVSLTAIYRYITPSVELAVVILAAFGIDDILRAAITRRRLVVVSGVAVAFTVAMALAAIPLYHAIVGAPHERAWAAASVLWGVAAVLAVAGAALLLRGRRQALALVAIVAVDVMALFVVPMFATPSIPGVDIGPVTFLRQHLGSYRFYSMGPLQPDYGAFYGVAQINTNDLPVPKAWGDYVTKHLDPNASPITFTGTSPLHLHGLQPPEAFVQRIGAYENVGVKYLLTLPGAKPPPSGATRSLRLVYSDAAADIYELPHPSPYFETDARGCTLRADGREEVRVTCPRPTVLVRRELYLPGWTATVSGSSVPVRAREGLFQSVHVPAGTTVVRFHYEPPHLRLAIVAAVVGILALAAIEIARRRRARASPATPSS